MSASDIDPRVAEQMRIIKERKEREAAEAAAAKAAQEAAFARQVEESKIVWEAELRIEMEAITFTPEDLDFLCTVAARGYTAAIADPRFKCERSGCERPRYRIENMEPFGATRSYTAARMVQWICPSTSGIVRVHHSGMKGQLEQARDAFRASWLRTEVGRIVADAQRAKQIAEAEAARVRAREEAAAAAAREAALAALKEKIVAEAHARSRGKCNLTSDRIQFGTPVAYTHWQLVGVATKPTLYLATATYGSNGDPVIPNPYGPAPSRNSTLQAPVIWNTDYEAGLIPFLPQCPVCSKQVSIATELGRVTHVGCPDHYHYHWDPATDTHYKYTPCPPPEPHNAATFGSGSRPTALPHKWDPKDPDGTIAAAARKEAEAADIRAQIAALQARLAALA